MVRIDVSPKTEITLHVHFSFHVQIAAILVSSNKIKHLINNVEMLIKNSMFSITFNIFYDFQ